MKIRALKNFGHLGETVPAGAIIDVDPAEFGGTFEDFKEAGLLEEYVPEPEPEAEAPAAPAPKPSKKGPAEAPASDAAPSDAPH